MPYLRGGLRMVWRAYLILSCELEGVAGLISTPAMVSFVVFFKLSIYIDVFCIFLPLSVSFLHTPPLSHSNPCLLTSTSNDPPNPPPLRFAPLVAPEELRLQALREPEIRDRC
jgi:hypothetical protein